MPLPLELGGIHDPNMRRALEQIAMQFPVVATGGGGGGGAPSGPAGGDLTGTYPNPGIASLVIVDGDISASAAIAESKLSLATDAAAGTGSRRTLGTGALQAAAGNDTRLSDSRAPNGSAGGDLSGTYPNPDIAAGVIVNADVNAAAAIAESKLSLATDAAAGTGSRRTLGTGALQAAAGNDTRLSDSRAPNGAAGGDLAGTYPSPTLAATQTTNARVAVKKAGSVIGTRRGINLIEGTNVTLTVADDAGNEDVDVTVNSSAAGSSTIPISVALPAGPTNGQMFVYEVQTSAGSPAANANVEWLFRWNSTTAKWHCIGGTPLRVIVDTAQATTTTAAYQDLTTNGPQFTAPFAGDYLFQMGAHATTSAANTPSIGLSIGGAAPAADAVMTTSIAAANLQVNLNRQVLATLTVGGTARIRYIPQTLATTFAKRVLTVQPIWVA